MNTQYLTIIGPPAIALFIGGWLRDAKIPKWLDTIIAFLVILLTAFLWALFAGKLVGDLPADTVVIAAYTAALIAGPMAALHAYLTIAIPSPFSAFMDAIGFYVPEPAPVPAPPTPLVPRSVTLPTTPQIVQRNSLLNDPAWRPMVAAPSSPSPLTDAVPAGSTGPTTGPMPVVTAPTPVAATTLDQGDQAAPPTTP